MINLIDNILNRITTYRLVLYYLMSLAMAAVGLSFLGLLPFQQVDLLVSLSVLVLVCWIANSAFAMVFNVPANTESLYITAFILALVITPRSPARYFSAPITVLYSNRTAPEIVYTDVLEEARKQLGIQTMYTLTDANRVPPDWRGGTGRVDAEMIAKTVPDYRERTFYLSGPRALVVGFEEVLRNIGIPRSRIKTDFFPGFA